MAASHTIFLVDDDQFLLNMYVVKFQNAGHTIQSFTSGNELLNVLREKPAFDALLLDLVMPEPDGFQILETIRNEGLAEDAKLIVLSNQGQEDDIKKAEQFNVDGYIVKVSAIPSEVLEKTIQIIEETTS